MSERKSSVLEEVAAYHLGNAELENEYEDLRHITLKPHHKVFKLETDSRNIVRWMLM
jgi:hypothetical protein